MGPNRWRDSLLGAVSSLCTVVRGFCLVDWMRTRQRQISLGDRLQPQQAGSEGGLLPEAIETP